MLYDAASGSYASDASPPSPTTAEGEPSVSDDAGGGNSSCPTPGGNSFTAGTLVLLASGKAVPISQLKAGDKVLAADTKTGKDQPETVTAVLVHHDTDLYDLTVKTSRRHRGHPHHRQPPVLGPLSGHSGFRQINLKPGDASQDRRTARSRSRTAAPSRPSMTAGCGT